MLTHFKIGFSVLHDIDSPKTKDGDKNSPAYSVNKKISDAIGLAKAQGLEITYRCSCPNFEQHHGMDLPTKDKPYESWKTVRDNDDVRNSVLKVLNVLLAPVGEETNSEEDGAKYESQLKTWIKANNVTDVKFKFD